MTKVKEISINKLMTDLKTISDSFPNVEITVEGGLFEIHYKSICVKTNSPKDVSDAIFAFKTLDNLDAEDF